MKKTLKCLLSVLIALTMLLSCLAFSEEPQTDGETGGSEEIVVQINDESVAPVESDASEETVVPVESDASEETVEPAELGEDEVPAEPEETDEGEAPVAPVDTGEGEEFFGAEEIVEGEEIVDAAFSLLSAGEPGEGECSHANTYTVNRYRTIEDGAEQIAGDSQKHRVHQAEEASTYCTDCNLLIKTELTGNVRDLMEAHIFYTNDGPCWKCGYAERVQDCEHIHKRSFLLPDFSYSYSRYVEDATDATHHTRIATYNKECFTCYDCGSSWEVELEESITEYEREAHFFWNGVCDCGYESHCTHSDYSTVTEYSFPSEACDHEQIPGNNNEHRIISEAYNYIYCANCGELLDEEYLGVKEGVEPHHESLDQVGHCELCGYIYQEPDAPDDPIEDECKHENVRIHTEYHTDSAEFVDSVKHLAHQKEYMWYMCADCGIYIDDDVDAIGNVRDVLEAHDVWEDDECICGYMQERVCTHANVECWEEWKYVPGTVTYDESGHAGIVKHIWNDYYCPDCYDSWLINLYEPYETVEVSEVPHDFWDGVCHVCGYVNTCAHENHDLYEWDGWMCEQIPGNNSFHRYIGDRWADVSCADCGEYLGEEYVGFFDREEPHDENFAELGYCRSCGYIYQEPIVPEEPEEPAKQEEKPDPKQEEPEVTEEPAPEVIETIQNMDKAETTFAAEEVSSLKQLDISEQMLVLETILGYGDLVNKVLEAENAELSEEAIALIDTIIERIAAMTEEEKAAFFEQIKELFTIETVIGPDGIEYEFAVLVVETEVDGEIVLTEYRFVVEDGMIRFDSLPAIAA